MVTRTYSTPSPRILTAKDFDAEPLEVTRARERVLCYYAQELCMKQ